MRVPPFAGAIPRLRNLSLESLCAVIERQWRDAGHPQVRAWVETGPVHLPARVVETAYGVIQRQHLAARTVVAR